MTPLLLACIFGAPVQAASLGDITPAGWPRFESDTSIKWKSKDDKGFTLKASLNGSMDFLNSPGDSYMVSDGSYKLKASFDASGALQSGDLTIRGAVTGLGITSTTLFTASLDAFAYDGTTLAFKTTITGGEICVVVGCTTYESIWIDLDTGGFDPTLKKFTDTGMAITTIPVPAAVWLFVSGIVGLASFTRRRKAG